jgi:predicted SnoaL-like aldol condensation-catalyzing enzyme
MDTIIKFVLMAVCAMPMLSWAADAQNANEKVILGYIDAMDSATARGAVDDVPKIAATYWTEDCVQHRAGVAPGRAGLIAALQSLPAFAKSSAAPAGNAPFKTVSIVTKEDRVILVRRSVQTDAKDPSKTTERYVFNIFRVAGGKIAENWWAMAM